MKKRPSAEPVATRSFKERWNAYWRRPITKTDVIVAFATSGIGFVMIFAVMWHYR